MKGSPASHKEDLTRRIQALSDELEELEEERNFVLTQLSSE